MELAYKNAQMVLLQDTEKIKREEQRTVGAMQEIADWLSLPHLVRAGTVVKSGSIHVQAVKVGDQTVVSRIVGMVVGIVIIGLGIALFKQSHLGNDSISALNMRLAELLVIQFLLFLSIPFYKYEFF